MTNSSVRCNVFGRHDDVKLTEVLTFLRGFSFLYGPGLTLHCTMRPIAAEVDALATHELKTKTLIQVNEREVIGELFARISTNQNEFLIFGQSTLLDWMKSHLLESRCSSRIVLNPWPPEVPPIRIFVSGDQAQVGKSTICLGLMGALLRSGYNINDIAYIKAATQCEKVQLVAKFCHQQGITCCDVGPIIFYRGFTRKYLRGETETSMQLLEKAKMKVQEVGKGKKVVIVDGVGYPAVGSICGVSNAHVAKTLEAPVVLVGKKGVGDAVDSFSLNATYFESHGVRVLGGIFNRLPNDGYYSLENCKESVTAYFEQFQPEKRVYGFLREQTDGGHSALDAEKVNDMNEPTAGVFLTVAEEKLAKKIVDDFVQSIDVMKLLADAEAAQKRQAEAGKLE